MNEIKNDFHNKEEIKKAIASKISRYFGATLEEASEEQVYKAVILSVKDILAARSSEFKKKVKTQQARKVYYLCMEFLVGRSLKNNLENLGLAKNYREVLAELGYSLDFIYEKEPDPGLGNGGLGRLAACFMDALTAQNYPATGYSLCYEYGLFKQRIIEGNQVELPDIWMPEGEVWLVPRTDKTMTVKFGGHVIENWENGKLNTILEDYEEVQAVPYDLLISGSGTETVNVLRLWRAKSAKSFNMNLFSQGQYVRALEENTNAEVISKVLYPSDNHDEGKLLRLSQQYFLSSASLQNIIAEHLSVYGTLDNFKEKVAIHINDTHPALCIPELMRILIDQYSYSWERAWDVTTHVISYTNHTVLPEALETWNEDLFKFKLPRIYSIVCEINKRFCAELWDYYPGDWDRISHMAIIGYSQVRMANMSVVASYAVNGVSKLHSDILTKTVFQDFHKTYPEKFTNVTNGITHRRWLCHANPALCELLDNCIGKEYRTDYNALAAFKKFENDPTILSELDSIKYQNKLNFSKYIFNQTGISLDIHSVFDVQAKRLHEYKRQLLNALKIISVYNDLLENPDMDIQPCTYLFAAKAAPGYYMAKEIIRLICSIGAEIEKNPKIREKLRVIFLEDYKVSLAEVLIPAADVSEQISLAGKEASGTGNMKFMINGAITIGTLDGANVEIGEAVGNDNIYIFGLTTREVDELWKMGYNSSAYYNKNEKLKKAVDRLAVGFNGKSFENLYQYLVSGYGVPDPYMCLADFESYSLVHNEMLRVYAQNKKEWNKKALCNIACAGRFYADRSVQEYAENIWRISKVKN